MIIKNFFVMYHFSDYFLECVFAITSIGATAVLLNYKWVIISKFSCETRVFHMTVLSERKGGSDGSEQDRGKFSNSGHSLPSLVGLALLRI